MKKIINRIFNEKFPPVFIAEISANHNGNINNAKKLILAAKKNGADIVKLQTYEPRNMTIDSSRNDFLVKDIATHTFIKNFIVYSYFIINFFSHLVCFYQPIFSLF